MQITSDQLDCALKNNKMNRKDLAIALGVGVSAVNTWVVRGSIPKRYLPQLEFLFQEVASVGREITIEFTDEEWILIDRFISNYPNIKLDEYARGKIFELCAGMSDQQEGIGRRNQYVKSNRLYGRGSANDII